LSFFDDDEGGPPRPAAAGPRRRPEPRRAQHARTAHGDRHALMVRRRVAAGAGVVLLIVIALVVDGCLKSGRESALKEYNGTVGTLIQESDQQVSRPLFETLAGASGKSPLDVENEVNQLRLVAQNQASHAKSLSVPSETQEAQRDLLLVMDLRAEGLAKIANLVRTALGGQGKQASAYIAGAMETFLASDVVYSQRVAPLIQQALAADDIAGVSTAGTSFLPNLGWLEASTVLARLTGQASSSSQNSSQLTPGTHGSALIGVSVGSTALEPQPAVNHLSGGTNPAFTVKVEDSGSNPETDVKVEVSVTAEGKQYKASHVIDKTEPGSISTVDIPVEGVPQGTGAQVTVYVQPVPGETNVENNKGTYLAVFGG
jgi:hypothetical protein